MRVLHLIKATGISGAEKHLIMLLAGLRERGIDAHAVVLVEERRPLDDYLTLMAERGIPARRVFIRRHIDRRVTAELRAIIRELHPPIVHTHLLHADWYGMLAARAEGYKEGKKIAVISSRHNDDAFRRNPILRTAHRALWQFTAAGIGISEAITRFSIEVEGANPARMHTIHYGLEPTVPLDANTARRNLRASLSIPPDAVVFGTVGRLIEQKGIAYAIRAFAELAPAVPAAHLAIVGDGKDRRALEDEVKLLGLGERVHFLGWRADAPALMAGFDVLLMPSLWEGFGLVLLEAMAQRIPVIASRVSAIPEIVAEEETGLLVQPRHVRELAAAMRRLVDDAPLRRHMGLMGEERLEAHFTAAQMIDKTIHVYQEVRL